MKKEVLRMCIVCREMKDKNNLIRIVKQEDGELKIDLSGKMNGRGAYICKDMKCVDKLEKSKALNRTFKQNPTESSIATIKEGVIGQIIKN